jgi:twitching motility protein PilT
VTTFTEIIQDAATKKFSDIHLKQGVGVFYRKGGRILRNVEIDLPGGGIAAMILGTLDERQKLLLERDRRVDYALQVTPDVRVRGNAFFQRKTLAATFRLISMRVPALSELGMPAIARDFALRPRGLVIVAGPSGSGKTTTAAALINEINRSVRRHIVTIEDPVEYVFREDKSMITQREIGNSAHSFFMGLRGALREDPDVVFIGEMRDLDTFSTAITMAETGHLVISTVQTIGASETVDRIVNMFPPQAQDQIRTQLSLNVQGILSQVLLPVGDTLKLVPAVEVLFPTFALRSLIRKGEISKIKGTMETSVRDNCMPMRMAVEDLAKKKQISEATLKAALANIH